MSINMSMNKNNNEIKKISPDKIILLNQLIKTQINVKFKKLNQKHKNILIKYLTHACVICGLYLQNDFFIEQLIINNCQDIFSIANMILPYYNLNKSQDLETLDTLFLNSTGNSLHFDCRYSTDHIQFFNSSDSDDKVENYFYQILLSVNNTFKISLSKLLPNWINIFPYTLSDYKNSIHYKNFIDIMIRSQQKNKIFLDNFLPWDTISNDTFVYNTKINDELLLIGYENIYGTIYNFLYNDIKYIKWLIFEHKNKSLDTVYPIIIILANSIGCRNISNAKWNQLDPDETNLLKKSWVNFCSESDNFIIIKQIIIFYLKYEYQQDNIKSLKVDRNCLRSLSRFYEFYDTDSSDQTNDSIDENFVYKNDQTMDNCIRQLVDTIDFENIYNFINNCMQKFRYTWYGRCCLDDNNYVYTYDQYYKNYILKYKIDNTIGPSDISINPAKLYVTCKNFYNYFKSMLNNNYPNPDGTNEYKLMSNSCSWSNLDSFSKNIFAERLFITNGRQTWFRITKNISRTYSISSINGLILNNINTLVFNKINMIYKVNGQTNNILTNVLFETLVINGMFSYFNFNPGITDSRKLPDKNKDNEKWKNQIQSGVDIEKYSDSYSFLTNNKISSIQDYHLIVKNTMWYTNFGADWVAQTQMYHHIINQRVLYITGATGAGKSTVAPFIILYGLKMLNFNNNVKVVCSQPRIQPTEDNINRISESLGFKLKNGLDYIVRNINYFQMKYSDTEKSIVDEEYHPCLRMVTDGTLYNNLNSSLFLKKSLENRSGSGSRFIFKDNIFDAVLVDEAHEHNSNMDIILTLMKFNSWINNKILLGIISATMEDDEVTYRKYYKCIDDNWKWPLSLNYLDYSTSTLPIDKSLLDYKKLDYNNNFIDRRIHLSPPFLTTNFKIEEPKVNLTNEPQNLQILRLVKDLVSTTPITNLGSDILVFQNGQNSIIKLVNELNNSTPENVLAIPFYSKLDKNILEDWIKKIANRDIRKKINIKKTNPITDLNDPNSERVDEGTYNRFIIVATNIAEASITIDTLKYVVDNGSQNVNIYDPATDVENLKNKMIAKPNQQQRRGRVGRKHPGTVYYVYDTSKLDKKVLFKICIENITNLILSLLTESQIKLINYESDPYFTDKIDNIPDSLKDQYGYINYSGKLTLYS